MVYCGKVKREYDPETGIPQFKTRRTDGILYLTGQCSECGAKTAQLSYEKDKDKAKQRAKEWKRRNADSVREAGRLRARVANKNRTAEQRAKDAERMAVYYRKNRERVRVMANGRKALKKAELIAEIPSEVLKPYLETAIRELDQPDEKGLLGGGVSRLARLTGVSERRISEVRNGGKASMNLDMVDKIAARCHFTLEEITERTREWALLTGADWPVDYLPKSRGYAERMDPSELRKRVLAMRELQAQNAA